MKWLGSPLALSSRNTTSVTPIRAGTAWSSRRRRRRAMAGAYRSPQPPTRVRPVADSGTSALDRRVRRVPVHGGDGAHRVGGPAGALVDAIELVLDVDEHEHARLVRELAHLLVLLGPPRRIQDAPSLPHHLADRVRLLGVVDGLGADEQPLEVAVGVGRTGPLGGDDGVV